MKHKKIKIATIAIASLSLIGGLLYYQFGTKKAYDYSDYYVDTKEDKTIESSSKENEEASEKELSLSLLKVANKDIVGILEFDDRVIYEPIVQAPDNDYYVRRNIEKNYANAGIPFVSADGNINSKNVVVYGHSSRWNNILFTPLMNYVDQTYYKKHDTFKFITESETRTYQIFAVLNMDLNNLDDSLEFTQASWDSNNAFNAFISDSINRELYKTGVTVDTEDKLMTLVTCDTRDNNKRMVILAKLINN
jgi:sortase B